MTRAPLLAAMALLLAWSPAPGKAQDPGLTAALMERADQKDWQGVRQIARSGGVIGELASWRILSAGEGGWREYRDFVSLNPDWPNLKRIRKEGEATIPPGTPLAEIDAFFGPERAQTGAGALRCAEALRAAGRGADADAEIARAWRELSLTVEEQNAFRARHGAVIAPHHVARADELLWRGLTGEALQMKPLVGAGWAALIEARVRLRRRANGVDAAINAVPASLAGDPGLAYERFLWRMLKDRYEGALEVIRAASQSADSLGRPEAWAERRRRLVRRLFREERFVEAYNLANRNHLTEGSHYSDLEWLAGWIALRRMGDPGRAEAHFSRFLAAVATPISFGRGHYWMGRAREAAGNDAGARAAYQEGARWQTSFYGQLAAQKIGAPVDAYLTAGPDGDWTRATFAQRSVAQAAKALSRAGDRRRAHWFLTHLADLSTSYVDLAGAADLATELGRDDAAIRISKKAARKGHVLRGYYYPVTELAQFQRGVEPAMAMAIARQESELNLEALSPAGARGIMQLMPGTAKKVAGWIGEPYSRGRLTTDWRYNATLGQTYLARRLDQYAGSAALAAAAYNAGSGRSDEWIQRFGDPRYGGVDWIDWIETIPFRETRNYVQRVLEGLQVYRSRIAGRPVAFQTEADARGRRGG